MCNHLIAHLNRTCRLRKAQPVDCVTVGLAYTPGMATKPDDTTPSVQVETEIEASVAEVWQALITDEGLARWMGSGSAIDPRLDGQISVPDVVGGHHRDGRVTDVESHRRLAFVWWRRDRPTERSTVTVELTEVDGRTRVAVAERVAPRPVVGFGLPSNAAVTSVVPPAVVAPVGPGTSAATSARSLIGTWSWRLALVTLACTAARV